MIDPGALKAYHRDLLRYCLQLIDEPMTAGDLQDEMSSYALSAFHPKEAWAGITPAAVAGLLKTMNADGLVIKSDPVRNARLGRNEVTWLLQPALRSDTPAPPSAPAEAVASAAPAPPPDPYAHLSREQLVTVLGVHDDISECVARFQTELANIAATARARLLKVGLSS